MHAMRPHPFLTLSTGIRTAIPTALITALLTLVVPAPGVAQQGAAQQGAAQQGAEPLLPLAGEESLQVELRTVPFYAVDEAGRPVHDLRPEEVELVVGGQGITPETFDAFSLGSDPSAAAGALPAGEGGQAGPETFTRPLSRHVFFLFDTAFASARSLRRSQETARGLVDRLPETDRLYLLLHHPERGFRQELGPLVANVAGKERFRQALEDLTPEIERLQTRAEASLPPMDLSTSPGGVVGGPDLGPGRNGTPREQVHNAYEQTGALGRSEYRSVAYQLAEAYTVFAAALRQIREPKLVLNFSTGIEDRLFFEGEVAFKGVGSSSASMYVADMRRADPMVSHFQGPLSELAATGAAMIFVNAAAEDASGRDSLRHMGEVTGGRVVEGVDVGSLAERIVGSTSAYYEAGFYSRPGLGDEDPTRVEVVIRRPGVRAFSPRRLESRLIYRALDAHQRRYLIVDLVHRGAEGRGLVRAGELGAGGWGVGESGAASPRMVLHELAGQLAGRTAEGGKLVLRAAWPEAVEGRKMDLYEVVLAVAPGGEEAEIVRFDRHELTATAEPLLLAAELPRGETVYVWGVVAVEPESGDTYFRRLMLQAPLQKAPVPTQVRPVSSRGGGI